MIQLVVSDIDGTLLPYGETVLSGEIFDLIEELKARGIPFCPTSGRQYHSIRSLFPKIADELSYVCENGGAIYGPGTEEDAPLLATFPMDRERALTLAREILTLPDSQLLITGARYAYLCQCTPEYVEHMRDFKGFQLKIVDDVAEIPEEILKVSAYCPLGTHPAVDKLGPTWSHVFQMAVAGEDWLDFTVADKGRGGTVSGHGNLPGKCFGLWRQLERCGHALFGGAPLPDGFRRRGIAQAVPHHLSPGGGCAAPFPAHQPAALIHPTRMEDNPCFQKDFSNG